MSHFSDNSYQDMQLVDRFIHDMTSLWFCVMNFCHQLFYSLLMECCSNWLRYEACYSISVFLSFVCTVGIFVLAFIILYKFSATVFKKLFQILFRKSISLGTGLIKTILKRVFKTLWFLVTFIPKKIFKTLLGK